MSDVDEEAEVADGNDAQLSEESAKKKGNGVTRARGSKEAESFAPKNQQLFLVEFLIDTVNLNPEGIPEEVMEGQTCVTLKFLNFPPMSICEKDFDPNKEHGIDKVRFNSGKSLMFAFTQKQCEEPPPMMAELVVSKKSLEGSGPEKFDLGTIKICMVQLFQQVYDVAKNTPEKLPASKSIKDCFMLIGRRKRTTGEVGVYVRLTCLGQNVVTEFQCGPNLMQDPILFKNREGKRVYQFTGSDKNGEEDECDSPASKEGCGCLRPPPTQTYPGGQGDAGRMPPPRRNPSVGGAYSKGSRVVLDVPDTKRSQGGQREATRTSGDCQVTSRGRADGGVTVSQLNANPDQNCFVLRVGDKGQIPDRGKMILEFRTPKQKILPKVLPPYHEEVAVQTDSPKNKGQGKGKKK